MSKKLVVFMLVVFAVLALCSCEEERGTASMKLYLKKSDYFAKTLLPNNTSSLEITRFRLKGRGPHNGEFDIYTDNASVTINGLEIGEWTVNAYGLNAEGVSLVEGSTTYALSQNSGTATITLDRLIGSGSLRVDVDWANTEVPNPVLSVYITPQGGSERQLSNVSVNAASRVATITENLAAGSYILRGVLRSGDFHVGGFVESVRIVGNEMTEGSVSISQMMFPDASGYFLLVNEAGTPIRGTISGLSTDDDGAYVLNANTNNNITFTLDSEYEDTPQVQIQWFLDGISLANATNLGKTNTITVNVQPGSHRIDAIVTNSLKGSFGSVSLSFMAMLNGPVGSLNKVADFSQILLSKEGNTPTYMSLDSSTIVSPLPGGKFLVISPSNGKMVVVKVVRNYLETVKVYSTSDAGFDFIPYITKVKSDEILNWMVFIDNKGGHENFTLMYFDQAVDTINRMNGTYTRLESPVARASNDTYLKFTSVADVVFAPSQEIMYVVVNGDQAGAVANPSDAAFGPGARFYFWKITNNGHDSLFRGQTIPYDRTLNIIKASISPSERYVSYIGSGRNKVYVSLVQGLYGITAGCSFDTGTQPMDVAMSSNGSVTTAGARIEHSSFVFSNEDWSTTTASINDVNNAADLLVYDSLYENLYAANKNSRVVYTLQRTNSETLNMVSSCSISTNASNSIVSMALAGSNMLVSTSLGQITLCKIVK